MPNEKRERLRGLLIALVAAGCLAATLHPQMALEEAPELRDTSCFLGTEYRCDVTDLGDGRSFDASGVRCTGGPGGCSLTAMTEGVSS